MGNETSQAVSLGNSLDNNIEVSWKKSTDCSFPVREGQCACSHGNKLYVFGGVVQGQGEELVESNDLLCFDVVSQTWSLVDAKGTLPPPRSAASLVAVDKKLFLFGGLSHQCGWFDTLFTFDIGTERWSEVKAEGTPPSARDKLQAAVVGSSVYYFGGFGPKQTGNEEDWEDIEDDDEDEEDMIEEARTQQAAEFGWFNDLHVLDTVSMKWAQPRQMNLGVPSPRAAHAMCAVGQDLFIFGGRGTEKRQNDLHVFNVATGKWDTACSCSGRQPGPRSFHTTTAVGSRVVVMGGRAQDNNHFADVHILDTETREWLQPKVSGTLPAGRGQHSAVAVGDFIVLYGGSGQYSPETMTCHKFFGDTYILKTADVSKGGSTTKSIAGQNGHSTKENTETPSTS